MRWVSERRVCASGLAAVLALLLATHDARAAGADPSYGRVDGDLSLAAGLGGAVAGGGVRGAAELRLRYLESLGLFGTYEEGFEHGEPRRLASAGLELRPLFLYRWLQGHETQRAWLDLTVDSFGLELGAWWAQPSSATFGATAGIQAGLGLEVPLLPRATGPWLGVHAGVRWSEAEGAGAPAETAGAREGFVVLTLSWHQVFVAHLVDLGDEAPR